MNNTLPHIRIPNDNIERIYVIKRSRTNIKQFNKNYQGSISIKDEYDPLYMVANGRWINPKILLYLWKQKSKLDILFTKKNKKNKLYLNARNLIYSEDKHGSSIFKNRAGDKLYEVLYYSNIINDLKLQKKIVFGDICGGPGAFSDVLFKITHQKIHNIYGIGITLFQSSGGTADWYPQLLKNKHFKPIYGPDNTGDIYNPGIIKQLRSTILSHDKLGAYLIMADGGFNVDSSDLSIENVQEIYTAHLLLSELLSAIYTLKPGGHFICKLFDTCSDFMVSFLYVCTYLFNDVKIIKPVRSRSVNGEKYLAACFFNKESTKGHKKYWLVKHIKNIHKKCYKSNFTPISLIPINIMLNDKLFVSSINHLNNSVATRQINSLQLVFDNIDQSKIDYTPDNKKKYGPQFYIPDQLINLAK